MSNEPWLSRISKNTISDPSILPSFKFFAVSSTAAIISGQAAGFVSSVASNRIHSPQFFPHILHLTKLFGTVGIVHGLTGGALRYIHQSDEFSSRLIAGCTSGIGLGIQTKSFSIGCAGCLGLGLASAFAKIAQDTAINPKPDPVWQRAFKPVFKADEIWQNDPLFKK